MSTVQIGQRVNTLAESIKVTTQLIARLSRSVPFAPTSGADEADTPEQARAELTVDIQEAIKQHQDEFDLLKEDLADAAPANNGQKNLAGMRSRRETGREQDAAKLTAMIARVEEDIKTTRSRFRRAQLQAKRNADQAVARERAAYMASLQTAALQASASANELSSAETHEQSHASMSNALFAGRRLGGPRKDPNATQDDLLLSATSDVTASLRRTHALLTSEVSRSRFAQETLDSSNKALEELNERYGSLDTMLAQSKTLLSTLLRSNKSDTWYLETAYMILAVTLGWLFFRRLLYGPLWWLVWLPVRTAISSTLWMLGATVGLLPTSTTADGARTSLSGVSGSISGRASATTIASRVSAETATANWGASQASASPAGSFSESIGSMLDSIARSSGAAVPTEATGGTRENTGTQQHDQHQQGQEQVRRGDGEPLRERDERTEPRNPKKRMFEEPRADQAQGQQQRRDEL